MTETTATAMIAEVPPFAERLCPADTVPIQIRALTFMEVRYMRSKIKGIEDDLERIEEAGRWLLRFGLLDAESLGVILRREPFEIGTAKTDALTELSLSEFLQRPNGEVEGAIAAISERTFPSDAELNRLDFTTPSAALSVVATKANESA